MDVKKQIWMQWQMMLHKQEERSKLRASKLLEQIKTSIPDWERVGTLTVTELHVIQSIGEQKQMNVTTIARNIGVTKSAISKITSKLMKKGLVERYQLQDNQKEVYFRLTSKGEKVFAVHEQFHSRLERRTRQFLDRYKEADLLFLRDVMRDATQEMDKDWGDE